MITTPDSARSGHWAPGPASGRSLTGLFARRHRGCRGDGTGARLWKCFAIFTPGQVIVVEEEWRGLLFAAAPHRVVASDADQLVTLVPDGTESVVGSNFGLPGTEHLDRSGRKLLAMQSLQFWPRLISETPTKLLVYTADRWSRVSLGWDSADGQFLGWYVNFERPARAGRDGIVSKDLVLDLYVNADGSWDWKDRDDFDEAIAQGVLEPELDAVLAAEARHVLRDLHDHLGAFDPRWQELVSVRFHERPVLPERFQPDGDLWALALPPPSLPA